MTPNEMSIDSSKGVPIASFSKSLNVAPGERIQFVFETKSLTKISKEALVAFEFRDATGGVVRNPRWLYTSPVVGEFQYLTVGPERESAIDLIDVTVPEGAAQLEVRGVQWKKTAETRLVSEPVVLRGDGGLSITETPTGVELENSSSNFRSRHVIASGAEAVNLTLKVGAGERVSKAPLEISFLGSDENELLGIGDVPQHPQFGSFINLEPLGEGFSEQSWQLSVPEGAKVLELKGVDWGEKSAVIKGAPSIAVVESQSSILGGFLERIEDFDSLIILDTTAPPLGHETLALRPNNLAAEYGALGSGVVFFPFSTIQEQPSQVSNSIVQFDRRLHDEVVTALEASETDVPKIYICSSFPSLEACATAARLKANGWRIVYECRDDMEEFNRVGYSKWYHVELERQMLQLADLVVSVSAALDEKLQSLATLSCPHFVVPNAVNESVVSTTKSLRTAAAVQQRNESRVLGYVGHLTESWFDWPAMIEVANLLPDVRFEIVGHGMPTNVSLPENIIYLGPKSHEEIARFVVGWRAGLIPFKDVPLTRSVDPNKIYEYQAWGMRTISAPMGMVDQYPSTWVYRDVDELKRSIEEVLEREYTLEEVESLDHFVCDATWLSRAKTMRDLMGVS